MNISRCELQKEYLIESIKAQEEGMQDFLFTLGCYPGEKIQLISKLASIYVINIKNARYSIDKDLAEAIRLKTQDHGMVPTLMSKVV